ncbi:MAG: DUF3306 domain-containing protein, partial [Burkholderiales bacterium]
DGFLSRWSRRKDAQRQGAPADEPVASSLPKTQAVVDSVAASDRESPQSSAPPNGVADSEPTKPLSLNDARALTAESDFVPFMARGVAPDVRNAAMKQLFADPHYNVMDGLDIYIEDYTKTVPLPISVIKRMAAAQFLGLFEQEKEPAVAAAETTQLVDGTGAGAAPLTELRAVADTAATDAVTSSDPGDPALPTNEAPAATRIQTQTRLPS